jgi:hypothetical protein
MTSRARPDYGVDGYPYLVGLVAAGLVGTSGGAALLAFWPRSVAMTVGAGALLVLGGSRWCPGSLASAT